MKPFIILLILLASCGPLPTVIEPIIGEPSEPIIIKTSEPAVTTSVIVTIDASNLVDTICAETDPLNWQCARRCLPNKTKSWCGAYDKYCSKTDNKDIKFCDWWKDQ